MDPDALALHLLDEEHERVIRLCIEVTDGRAPVIAGAGANDTAYAVNAECVEGIVEAEGAFE